MIILKFVGPANVPSETMQEMAVSPLVVTDENFAVHTFGEIWVQ